MPHLIFKNCVASHLVILHAHFDVFENVLLEDLVTADAALTMRILELLVQALQ